MIVLTERYADKIPGVLSCFDRVVITGTLLDPKQARKGPQDGGDASRFLSPPSLRPTFVNLRSSLSRSKVTRQVLSASWQNST